MSETSSSIVALRNQEAALALPVFDEEVAYTLGTLLRAKCLSVGAPVVIDIRTPSRRLFFVALPGSTPDNEDWARRKGNVALRCHASSMLTSETLKGRGSLTMARRRPGSEGLCFAWRRLPFARAMRRGRRSHRGFGAAVSRGSRHDRHDPRGAFECDRSRNDPIKTLRRLLNRTREVGIAVSHLSPTSRQESPFDETV